MTSKKTTPKIESKNNPKLRKIVLEDIRHGGFKRTLLHDLRDIYNFYLDDATRIRLEKMSRFKRWIYRFFWLIKSLILKLTPMRRLLLLLAIVFFLAARSTYRSGNVEVDFNLNPLGFLILLFVLALELKDKLLAQNELAIGRAVQFALMPDHNPRIPGWDVWLYTQPANEVGGDLVDYLRVSEDHWGISLGDVAGKGLGAALLMSKLQATIRALAPNFTSLSEFGAQMNAIFCRDGLPSRFVSLVYLEMKADSDFVRLLNAGHLPPIILHHDSLEELSHTAPALGIHGKSKYNEQRIKLQSNDLLLVYSDGLTEARNEQGEFFGEKRLFNLLPKLTGLSGEAFGKRLLNEVKRFMGEARASDDLSLVVLKRSS